MPLRRAGFIPLARASRVTLALALLLSSACAGSPEEPVYSVGLRFKQPATQADAAGLRALGAVLVEPTIDERVLFVRATRDEIGAMVGLASVDSLLAWGEAPDPDVPMSIQLPDEATAEDSTYIVSLGGEAFTGPLNPNAISAIVRLSRHPELTARERFLDFYFRTMAASDL